MAPAIVLAILVTANDAGSDTVRAMRIAAAEALGSETLVVVEEENLLSDRVALRAEDRLRAAAVVQLAWIDAAQSRARLRLHVADGNGWTERTLSFVAADTEPERGRTLGFAVTSMLPEEVLAARSRILLPRSDDAPVAKAAPAAPAAAATPSEPVRYAVRLAAIGSTGIDGSAGGIGGAVDGELFFGAAPSLRAGLGVRTGGVPGLTGNDLAISLRAGMAFWPLPPSAAGPLAVGVRLDALALHHDLSHQSEAGGATGDVMRQGRWLAGMDVAVELGVRLGATVYLVTAAGAEIAFGATDVLIDNRIVATIPPLRGVGEVGLRLLF